MIEGSDSEPHRGARVGARGISFHFGLPVVVGPPAYYVPPPVPVYAPPPPQTCHEYQTTMIIDGKPQPVYGTACLQPDGTWRLVQ